MPASEAPIGVSSYLQKILVTEGNIAAGAKLEQARRSLRHEQCHLSYRSHRGCARDTLLSRLSLGGVMQRENNQGREPADFAKAKTEVSDRVKKETQSAGEALHDARDEVARRAVDYASEAQEVLSERAEETQRDIGSSLAAFGGALRAASDHLANSDQSSASNFMRDAAGGLERLSSSLKQKPFGEVLGEIQNFGRQNPGTLIAGSVLAGLALGRFIKASPPETRRAGQSAATPRKTGKTGRETSRQTGAQASEPWDDATTNWGVDGGAPRKAAELKK
ncbi:hypothetical protein [Mesorhizobium sp.]|uniref:hypothetical protein n=1 Tax=Mesorhizobium sp. TaxID=1871066 RepID=UPI0025B8D803|nr:hypothetical protein [Mesorhizobium sp.]